MKPGDKVRVQLTVDGGFFDAVLGEKVHEPSDFAVWRVRIGAHSHLVGEDKIYATIRDNAD